MSFTILPVYGVTEEQLSHGPDLLSPARVAEIEELKEQVAEKKYVCTDESRRQKISLGDKSKTN